MVIMTASNNRCVPLSCVQCGKAALRFYVANDVIIEGKGRIACSVPCAVCPECVDRLLKRVQDPPGLVIFDGLSAIVAQELLENFPLMLSKSDAVKFLATLFPELRALDSARVKYL